MGLLDDWLNWRQSNRAGLLDATTAGADATLKALRQEPLSGTEREALVNTPAAWLGTDPMARAGKATGLLNAALDMSPEARAARAAEQGYTMDVYHGTGKNFKAFNPDKGKEASNTLGRGVYTAFDPAYAGNFAPEVGGRVLPLKAKVQAPFTLDRGSALGILNEYPAYVRSTREASGQPPIPDEKLTAWMQAEQAKITDAFAKGDRWGKMALDDFVMKHNDLIRTKHDAIVDGGQMVVFDPANVRSRFAAFDPARANDPDLLAAFTPAPLGGLLSDQASLDRRTDDERRKR